MNHLTYIISRVTEFRFPEVFDATIIVTAAIMLLVTSIVIVGSDLGSERIGKHFPLILAIAVFLVGFIGAHAAILTDAKSEEKRVAATQEWLNNDYGLDLTEDDVEGLVRGATGWEADPVEVNYKDELVTISLEEDEAGIVRVKDVTTPTLKPLR